VGASGINDGTAEVVDGLESMERKKEAKELPNYAYRLIYVPL
jgi:hypothetical protein